MRRRYHPGAVALLAAAFAAPLPAVADDGPVGIAFAQAEEGTWWCRDPDSRKAIACALALCAKGAGGQDCHPTRWCLPAGWSGLMIGWLPEFHTTTVVCGLPGQAAVGAALHAICDAGPEFTRCDFVQLVDPDGDGNDVSGESWLGPTATGSPD